MDLSGTTDPMALPADLNPFEATFHLLRNLSQEIADVKSELFEEQRQRQQENIEIHQMIDDIRNVKNTRFEEVISSIQNLWEVKTARFEKFEKYVEEMREQKSTRIERLECKLDAEISDRFRVCQDIVRKSSADAAQWRRRVDKIDKDIVDHKKQLEVTERDLSERHEELKEEVGNQNRILRQNTMAKDPFKHFRPNTGNANSPTTASTSYRSPFGTSLNSGSPDGAGSTSLPTIDCPPKQMAESS